MRRILVKTPMDCPYRLKVVNKEDKSQFVTGCMYYCEGNRLAALGWECLSDDTFPVTCPLERVGNGS